MVYLGNRALVEVRKLPVLILGTESRELPAHAWNFEPLIVYVDGEASYFWGTDRSVCSWIFYRSASCPDVGWPAS